MVVETRDLWYLVLSKQSDSESISLNGKNKLSVIYFNKRPLEFPKLQHLILVFVFTDGGIRWRPAEQPCNCQHPGHRCQWQHTHICWGLLQCRSLHRHAAWGDCTTGNQSQTSHCFFFCSLSLALRLTPPFLSPSHRISLKYAQSKLPQQSGTLCWQAKPWNSSLRLICSHDRLVRKNVYLLPHCTGQGMLFLSRSAAVITEVNSLW